MALYSCGGKTDDGSFDVDDNTDEGVIDDGIIWNIDGGNGGGGGESASGSGGGSTSVGGSGTGGIPTDATGGQGSIPSCDPLVARPGVSALYLRNSSGSAAPDNSQFFDYPWPEISRPLSDLSNLPNPATASGCTPSAGSELARLLTDAIDPPTYRQYLFQLAGSSTTERSRHPIIYIQFDGALNEAGLPSPERSLGQDAPVFLMNVDHNSPHMGALIPIESTAFHGSLYVPDNTLAVMPAVGFPLDPSTRYALVVLSRLGDSTGAPLGASLEFLSLLPSPGCPEVDDNANYRTAVELLDETRGLSVDDLAALTVFETGNPTAGMNGVAAGINNHPGAAQLADITVTGAGVQSAGESFYVVEGSFNTLIQQRGAPPYLPQLGLNLVSQSLTVEFDSGDKTGSFISDSLATTTSAPNTDVARVERIPFVLTVPTSVTTADVALPLVVYGTGTGGSRTSARQDGVAELLAQAGYATLTIDAVMHASRSHSENIDPELLSQLGTADVLLGTNYTAQLITLVESGDLFLNPFHLEGARGNSLQGAVDYLWQAKVFSEAQLNVTLGGSARNLSFVDLSFFGHSQGGSLGPLLAKGDTYSKALLSGASGHIPSILLDKTKPDDTIAIGPMLEYIACDASPDPLNAFHPVMAALGHFFEPADAEHFVGQMVDAPNGISLFLLQGIDDNYSPPRGNEALSTAAFLREVTTADTATAPPVPGQALLSVLNPGGGYNQPTPSLSANLGSATVGFARYGGASCSDAHFVFTCNSEAVGDWVTFFSSASLGAPVIQ